MKNLFLLLFVMTCFNLSGQSFKNASVVLIDGTTIDGQGKFNRGHRFVFKKDVDSKKEILDDRKITTITLQSNMGVEVYEYKKAETSREGRKELFQLIEGWKLNLYRRKDPGSSMSFGNGMTVMRVPESMYYYSNLGDENVFPIKNTNPNSEKFEREVAGVFSACPSLIAKLNSKYFTRTGLQQVFAYYNNPGNCP